MKMTLEATLDGRRKNCVSIGVKHAAEDVKEKLIPAFYISMLRAMRDAHEHEFHVAMIAFINEEMDDTEGDDD